MQEQKQKTCGLGYTEEQLLMFLADYKTALLNAEYSVAVQKDNVADIEKRLRFVRGESVNLSEPYIISGPGKL